MKFSCGYTDGWYRSLLAAEVTRLKSWHRVFLWWPRTIGHKGDRAVCGWLTYAERRCNGVCIVGPRRSVKSRWVKYSDCEYREINA